MRWKFWKRKRNLMGDFKRCECDGVIYKLDRAYYGKSYPYHGACASCGKLFTQEEVNNCRDGIFYEGIKAFLGMT